MHQVGCLWSRAVTMRSPQSFVVQLIYMIWSGVFDLHALDFQFLVGR